MASIAVSPSSPSTGDALAITGSDFLPSTVVTVSIPALGVQSEITSDAGGFFGTDDIADHAVATLTIAGAQNAVAAETVTIGAVTYTWRAAPTTVANEVKVGADGAASLDNLKAAINLEAGSGSLYGSGTAVHPTVVAVRKPTTLSLLLAAKTGGTGGNSLASTETMTQGSFGGGTFSGGSAATGVSAVIFSIEEAGTYVVQATDGTNSASASVQIFTS